MEKVNSLIKELGLDKWVVKAYAYKNDLYEKNQTSDWNIELVPSEIHHNAFYGVTLYDNTIYDVNCENDNWTWNISLIEDPDYDDGYLGIRNLVNKKCGSIYTDDRMFVVGMWENTPDR